MDDRRSADGWDGVSWGVFDVSVRSKFPALMGHPVGLIWWQLDLQVDPGQTIRG